ncbi:MAG: histidine phosphatase family protein [Oscillospiraceae bacterium]|jgi:broad specificity phosphatase PhoE|nr:histidine phosphatase family protein [Oscillospiraceae bacterium]
MTLLFLRHGQTDWNAQGLFQGRTDIPLNEAGRAQARAQAAALLAHDPPVDVIYASPLLRARETAEIVQGALGAPIYFDGRLTERCFGSLEGTPIVRGLGEEGLAQHGAESFAELHERVFEFLEEIKAKHPGQCVLVAAHGNVGRMVQYCCNGGGAVRIENGALMRFDF